VTSATYFTKWEEEEEEEEEEEDEEEEEEPEFNLAPRLVLCTDPSMTHAPHVAGREQSFFNCGGHRVSTTMVTIVHGAA
jgi:hypothetical protein